VRNKFISVSTECAFFIFRVKAELIRERKNVIYVGNWKDFTE